MDDRTLGVPASDRVIVRMTLGGTAHIARIAPRGAPYLAKPHEVQPRSSGKESHTRSFAKNFGTKSRAELHRGHARQLRTVH